MFVFDYGNHIDFFEAIFLPNNFLHLTGLKTSLTSIRFLENAYKRRLTDKDFEFSHNGTAPLKLDILQNLMSIHCNAKICAEYDNSKIELKTEKLVGNIRASLGFVKKGRYYYPNTAIKEDIRDISNSSSRILFVFRKPIKQEKYTELCYTAKGLDFNTFKFSDELKNLLDIKI